MRFLPCCCLTCFTHDMEIGAIVHLFYSCFLAVTQSATTMYPKKIVRHFSPCVNKCPMVKGSFRRCDDDRFISNFSCPHFLSKTNWIETKFTFLDILFFLAWPQTKSISEKINVLRLNNPFDRCWLIAFSVVCIEDFVEVEKRFCFLLMPFAN